MRLGVLSASSLHHHFRLQVLLRIGRDSDFDALVSLLSPEALRDSLDGVRRLLALDVGRPQRSADGRRD